VRKTEKWRGSRISGFSERSSEGEELSEGSGK